MTMPWWRRVVWKEVMVVSCPPCWVEVETKTAPGFPTKAPFAQSWPVLSRNWRIWPHMFPNRVGVPKRIPSASSRSFKVTVATWENSF